MKSELSEISAVMEPYAPQHEDFYLAGSVGLGCRILRTTPESIDEKLPFQCPASGLVIVADARLDNRKELINALNITRSSIPDGELLLAAYNKWGRSCGGHLLGDFSFVVWDPRERSLFAMCDQMGARPFHYFFDGINFAFASQPEALVCLGEVAPEVDEDWLASIFVSHTNFWETDGSCIKSIKRLQEAHHLALQSSGALMVDQYWSIEQTVTGDRLSHDEYQEAFREIFGRAVHARLRSIHEPAVMASGGMDTAAIVGAIKLLDKKSLLSGKIHTYSAIAGDIDACIESQCITSLVSADIFSSHFIRLPSLQGALDEGEIKEAISSAYYVQDIRLMLYHILARTAAKTGVNVMLHGASGDLTQASHDNYIAPIIRQGRWLTAWREIAAASQHHTHISYQSTATIAAKNLVAAYVPYPLRRQLSSRRYSDHYPDNELISAEFSKRIDLAGRIREVKLKQLDYIKEDGPGILTRQMAAISKGVRAFSRSGGRAGVEMRDPWSDRKVVEFFAGLPLNMKVRAGRTKYLSRTAFGPELDEVVTQRVGKEFVADHAGGLAGLYRLSLNDIVGKGGGDIAALSPYVDISLLRSYLMSADGGDQKHLVASVDCLGLVRWLSFMQQHSLI
ncbi:MAG: asparagine synthase-related protein [Pseudomonadales bacterium]